jgi:hypothetical protein
MSGPSSTKRQRTNTIGASVSGSDGIDTDIIPIIAALPVETVRSFLAAAAYRYSPIASLVLDEHRKIVEAQQAKVIDFDHYSKSVWKVINVTYSKLSGSRQYEASSEAIASVEGYIEAIGRDTPAHASFGTKKSALETLRKIGKTIALSTDVVAYEVRIQFQNESCLETTMLQIAKSMTEEERTEVLTDEFEEKLEELEGLAEGYCIFEKLKDVRRVLSGEQASLGEVTEEDGDDDEEKEDEREREQVEQTDEGTESSDEDYHNAKEEEEEGPEDDG